jgi:hypothetical protein
LDFPGCFFFIELHYFSHLGFALFIFVEVDETNILAFFIVGVIALDAVSSLTLVIGFGV